MDINLKSLGGLLPQSSPLSPLTQAPTKVTPSTLSNFLQTGAQLTAMVVEAKGGNRYLLEVFQPGRQAGVRVSAQSVTALESGHPLQLEVVDGGPPLQVRLLRQSDVMTGTPKENALRQFLPKQQELSSLVNQLANLGKNQAALPADIQQLARNLLESLPDKNTLADAQGLKQAIRDSGLFLESKLAQLAQTDAQIGGDAIDPTLINDLKAKLLVLADALTSGSHSSATEQAAATPDQQRLMNTHLPDGDAASVAKNTQTLPHRDNLVSLPNAGAEQSLKDLSDQTEGALAKLVLNQLSSLPQPDANQQVWRLDIPFTLAGQPESAKLEIEREAQEDGSQASTNPENAPWTVTVEVNPPGLGKLGGKITLHQGAVNAFFWSDTPATAELVRDNLPLLEAKLEAAGLKTGRLDASVGIAPTAETDRRPQPHLLDLRA